MDEVGKNWRDIKKALAFPEIYLPLLYQILSGIKPSFRSYAYNFNMDVIGFTK